MQNAMWTVVKVSLLAVTTTFLCCPHVPSSQAAPLLTSFLQVDHFADLNPEPDSTVTKRRGSGAAVNAWSICPPHMADVDCFYAYLRVYARLRKAAEESDRVSMRNIDLNPEPDSTVTKRRGSGAGVNAWSICPPHMADVECFYAYLRVYARLRKAAEESDRVSMRNIGKRSSVTSFPGLSRRDIGIMCAGSTSPAQCFQVVRTLQASNLNGN